MLLGLGSPDLIVFCPLPTIFTSKLGEFGPKIEPLG